jgi:hypothetical protein
MGVEEMETRNIMLAWGDSNEGKGTGGGGVIQSENENEERCLRGRISVRCQKMDVQRSRND